MQEGESPALDLEEWKAEWGVTDPAATRGGVTRAQVTAPAREVTLLQRKAAPLGKGNRQDDRLDSPRDAEDEAGEDDRRREL